MNPHLRSARQLKNTLLLCFVTIACSVAVTAQSSESPWGTAYEPSFGILRDTLYLLDSSYLEVRLDQQMIYQRFRSGRVVRYPCSTGDPTIADGIATREGIFTIQYKEKKHLSAAFNVYLNYWMPFDGGIGFHGLEGRSYYRHLGRERSSHGCVRIANETGAQLFKSVRSGTVVYVHGGSPARILRFGDSSMRGLVNIDEVEPEVLARRLDAIEDGRWNDSALAVRIGLPSRFKISHRLGVGRVGQRIVAQRPIPLVELPTPTLRSRPKLREITTMLSLLPTETEED